MKTVVIICCVCLSLIIVAISAMPVCANDSDNPERELPDDPTTVIISGEDLPNPNDDSPDVVVVDEDTPLGGEVDKTDNATNGGNIWIIVGISASAIAVAAIVAAIIVKKVKAK